MIYEDTINALVKAGTISTDQSVLVICGGRYDRDILSAAGFKNVTISNLDPSHVDYVEPFKWDRQDAEKLTYQDGSFDFVIVHAGLHHCYSPHRALVEMLRVARRAALVFESRDSLLLNVAKRLGFTMDYEIESVSGTAGMQTGGVCHTGVPNFIYRWTEREIFKTVRTADPAHVPDVEFFYHLQLPHERFEKTGRPLLRYSLLAMSPILEAIGRMFPRQSNEFGFLITKSEQLHPWLEHSSGQIVMKPDYAEKQGRVYQTAAPDAPWWQPSSVFRTRR